MELDIIIRNYRSFSESSPAKFKIKKGIASFVGVNNSGKSSILKFFYEFRNLFQALGNPSQISGALRGPAGLNGFQGVYDRTEVFHNQNDRDLIIELEGQLNQQSDAGEKTHQVKFIITVPRNKSEFVLSIEVDGTGLNAEEVVVNSEVFRNDKIPIDLLPFQHICSVLSNTLYIGPFRNILNLGDQPNYYDIASGQSFIKQWREIKEGNNKAQNKMAIKLTNDIRRIFDYESLDINPSANDETLTVAINGESYKLPELGSGLTQFIIVLANASIKRPAYILIDEPELNLHPSLQLDFLTTLASYSSEGVLFATHSLGLARAGSDLIYSVFKKTNNESTTRVLEDTPELPEFLGELSFSGYRELGFNKILLVEGRTDIKPIQQFLRLYKQEHKIVLLPLGGDQLINGQSIEQLEELKRITINISVLIDSERSNESEALSTKRQAFVDNCKKLSIPCHVLERRALENYLTDRAVKLVKKDKYRSIGPYEKREDVDPIWGKEENWRIAREMTEEELAETDLGKFLGKL